EWKPDDYHDEFRERLQEVIRKRMKADGAVAKVEEEADAPADATTNVVDFMSLLQKSLDSKKRTPARKDATSKVVKKTAGKSAARKSAKPAKAKTAKKATKASKAAPARKAG